MDVLFLTLYPDLAASPRYRVTQFIPFLEAHGIRCTVASALLPHQWQALTGPKRNRRPFWYHFTETRRRFLQILSARRYDIVFVQKAITTAYLRGAWSLLRRRARRLVYDLDDAVHLAPPHPLRPPWTLLEEPDQVRRVMREADLVLAGNAWLVEEAIEAGAKAVYFPTVVDTERFRPASEPTDTYRIGWIGNPSTIVCIEPASRAIAQTNSTEFCFVGADPKDVPWPRTTVRPWSLDSEVTDVQQFSVGIMPMPQSPWMRGKCALKALLYMACAVPCVASPFGAVMEFIEHDRNGLLAEGTQEWMDAFERLRDPTLRRRIGEEGRTTVEARYSLRAAAPHMQQWLEGLL